MGTLIVRCDNAVNLRAIEREVRNHAYVTDFKAYNGLRRFGEITHTDGPDHKNDLRNFLYHLVPVYGVLDGDNPMISCAQENVATNLTLDAREQPINLTQVFHAWDNKPGIIPWSQRPLSTTFLRESDRRGSNIVVSVHDAGVDASHTAEFGSRVTQIYNGPGDGPGDHGTSVGSIIAGANVGFLGDATVLDAKCFNSSNSGGVGAGVASLDALVTWVQSNLATGDHVIANCSFGSTNLFANEFEGIVEDVEDEGIALFAASGNFAWNLNSTMTNFWPAEGLLYGAVGAVNAAGQLVNFSNLGSMVHLHGLGWKVPCARVGNNNYKVQTGTSFASPSVAGAYGTWATTRDAPRSQSEVRQMMSDYIDFCKAGKVKRRPNELHLPLATRACIAKADTSSI